MRQELANIESILTNMVPEADLVEFGADDNGSRPLHLRVMRLLVGYRERIDHLSAPAVAPVSHGHQWWCAVTLGVELPCDCMGME